MDWKEVTIYTTTAGIGPVEALLEEHGVEGYVLEDAADFEEFLKAVSYTHLTLPTKLEV